ncbi:type IV secretory system conjugative DNA transfer family protein [Xanthobacter sp. VTT E-85241]|uniref:type IV secretory system conjugative DNA transfer family protein n=1 Tax=Roseixanthobacter finlandensis TaxID=3119922 RepID=UPI0037269CA3
MDLLLRIILAPFILLSEVGGAILKGLLDVGEYAHRSFWGHKEAPKHGDAAWADRKVLKANGNLDPRGFYVGRMIKPDVPIFGHFERSAIVMAAPGTGKSQTIIAGFHALELIDPAQRPVIIISDAANEIYSATAALFVRMGYMVGKIDLESPMEGGKYDVLSFVRTTDDISTDADIESLCELLVPRDHKERQPHFRDFARQMLHDAILLNVKYEGNNKTIAQIAEEIIDDDLRDAMIKRMKVYGSTFAAIKTFQKLGTNEGPSMLSTSLNRLKIWRSERIKEVSTFGRDAEGNAARGWKWEDVFLYDKPTVMFVRAGLAGGETGGEFTRVVFGNAVNTVMRMWDRMGKPMPRPVRIIADEAKDMGHCGAIVKAHNVLRKAHVTIMLCFLSKKDLDTTYADDADTLWNGCDHVVFGGCKDMGTNEAYSRLIGDRTIENQSYNVSDHGQSKGASEMGVRLMKPDQIFRMPKDESLLILGNTAVKAKKAYRIMKSGVRYV